MDTNTCATHNIYVNGKMALFDLPPMRIIRYHLIRLLLLFALTIPQILEKFL